MPGDSVKTLDRINAETKLAAAEKQREFLALFRNEPYATKVCREMQLNYLTFAKWVQRDAKFREQYETLKQELNVAWCDEAKQIVKSGMRLKGGEWLAVKVLENHDPEWKPKQDLNAIIGNITIVSNVRDVKQVEAGQSEVIE